MTIKLFDKKILYCFVSLKNKNLFFFYLYTSNILLISTFYRVTFIQAIECNAHKYLNKQLILHRLRIQWRLRNVSRRRFKLSNKINKNTSLPFYFH